MDGNLISKKVVVYYHKYDYIIKLIVCYRFCNNKISQLLYNVHMMINLL
jgi:hypothetical protein